MQWERIKIYVLAFSIGAILCAGLVNTVYHTLAFAIKSESIGVAQESNERSGLNYDEQFNPH